MDKLGSIGARCHWVVKVQRVFPSYRAWSISARLKSKGHLGSFMQRWKRNVDAGLDHDTLSALAGAARMHVRWLAKEEGPIWIGEPEKEDPRSRLDSAVHFTRRKYAVEACLIDALREAPIELPKEWSETEIREFFSGLAAKLLAVEPDDK